MDQLPLFLSQLSISLKKIRPNLIREYLQTSNFISATRALRRLMPERYTEISVFQGLLSHIGLHTFFSIPDSVEQEFFHKDLQFHIQVWFARLQNLDKNCFPAFRTNEHLFGYSFCTGLHPRPVFERPVQLKSMLAHWNGRLTPP